MYNKHVIVLYCSAHKLCESILCMILVVCANVLLFGLVVVVMLTFT